MPGIDTYQFDDHLQLIAEIGQAFTASLNIDHTLHNALEKIMQHLNAEAASIFLLQDNKKTLKCRACTGPVNIIGMELPADQGIAGKVVEEDCTQMICDVSKSTDFSPLFDQQTNFTTRSIICAPLSIKGDRLGTLELVNKKSGDGLFNEQDQQLLTALASSASLAIHNATMTAALVEQERMQKELQLAREIQQSFLPSASKADLPIYALNIPAGEVSGDFYDYFVLEDKRIYFNLGDVSGKGMNAALLMAKTSSLFHCLGKVSDDPGQLLSIINNELVEKSMHGMFVTMIAGLYDPANNSVKIAIAGHPPPLLKSPLQKDGDEDFQLINAQEPPLGITANIDYPITEINLNGDSLYLYSDGITEARTTQEEQLGIEGLKTAITDTSSTLPVDRLDKIVNRVMETHPQIKDDVTLLLLEVM